MSHVGIAAPLSWAMRATEAMFVIGMIPGITGLSMLRAAQVVDEREVRVDLEEELCDREVRDRHLRGEVVAVGPLFAARGCTSGCAATPIENRPLCSRTCSTSSSAYR